MQCTMAKLDAITGTWSIIDGAQREDWDLVQAEANSVERLADLTGWGGWKQAYAVDMGDESPVYYFVDPTDPYFVFPPQAWLHHQETRTAGLKPINLTMWEDRTDEYGDPVFAGTLEIEDETKLETTGMTMQVVADELVAALVAWMMDDATPAQMIALVEQPWAPDESQVQAEIAAVLGVTQPTVSAWLAGKHGMDGAVRTHIMRMRGVRRVDRKWVIV